MLGLRRCVRIKCLAAAQFSNPFPFLPNKPHQLASILLYPFIIHAYNIPCFPSPPAQLETDKVPLLETGKVPLLETDKVPLLETDKVPFLETDKVPLLETDKVPLLETDKVPLLKTEKSSSIQNVSGPIILWLFNPIPPHQFDVVANFAFLCLLFRRKSRCRGSRVTLPW